jgi:hypothetical protein
MATNWRVYQKDTVATQLDRSDLPGFFSKKVVVGLHEGALVLRNGEPMGMVTEAQVPVAAFLDQVKSQFALGDDISVYFVDLAPFDLTIFLGEQSTTSAAEQVAENAHVKERRQTMQDMRPGDSAEPRSWWLRKAVQRIGWLHEEPAAAQDRQSQESASVSAQWAWDVSQVSVVALSADRELISAACRLRLRVDPHQPKNLMGLLKGKNALATWDLVALLKNEFFGKVLVPEIARHSATSLRANRDLLASLESEVRQALTSTLSTFALVLDDFSLTWGLTEPERQEIACKRGEREEEALEFANTRRVAHLNRLHEIEKTRLANLQELKNAQATGNEDLKTLLLAAQLKRNLLIRNQKVDFAQVEAQVREISLQAAKLEAHARLEHQRAKEELRLEMEDRAFRQKHAARLAAIEADDKEMWSMVKMQIEMATQKHERELSRRRLELDADFRKMQADIEDHYQQRKLKLEESTARMGMMERLVGQGLSSGQADARVLNTLLQHATEQEYATSSDEMVKARAAAQAAAQNVQTYRTAQADERGHQAEMTRLAAEMMGAAKPTPAPVILPGTALPPGQVLAAGNPPQPLATPHSYCPSCRQEVGPKMKFCPSCGKSLTELGSSP